MKTNRLVKLNVTNDFRKYVKAQANEHDMSIVDFTDRIAKENKPLLFPFDKKKKRNEGRFEIDFRF